jgi:hypothetical protein
MRIEVGRFLIEADDNRPPAGTCGPFGQREHVAVPGEERLETRAESNAEPHAERQQAIWISR